MLNRTALLLRYKEPAIRWINEADPVEGSMVFTGENVNTERTVYLISSEDGGYGDTQTLNRPGLSGISDSCLKQSWRDGTPIRSFGQSL